MPASCKQEKFQTGNKKNPDPDRSGFVLGTAYSGAGLLGGQIAMFVWHIGKGIAQRI